MCKVKTPKYEKPAEYARVLEPDNTALYNEALTRAGRSSGGRKTLLTGLQGVLAPPNLGAQYGQRLSTVLG